MPDKYPRRILPAAAVIELAREASARVLADTGTRVAPELIVAIIERESYPRFNANSYRREADGRESWGLMQILTDTARMMGYAGDPAGLLEPRQNVYRGARYLAWQLRRYKGDVTAAVAAYNAGTAKRRADGSFITTPGYVAFVMGKLADWGARLAKTATDNPGPTVAILLALAAAGVLALRGRA